MAILAGIDEAGYGPLLGPLTVSAAAFRVPDDSDGNLWGALKGMVNRKAREGRLQVHDSKLVYGGDLSSLERNVLPFLAQVGLAAASTRALAASLGSGVPSVLDAYPWYKGRDSALPAAAQAPETAVLTERLASALSGAGISFVFARTEILDAAEFNREMKLDQSKPIPLARRVSVLMKALWDKFGSENLRIVVDKQGGRNFYTSLLRATFENCRFEALVETAQLSEYRVWDGSREASIKFMPRADAGHMPVALASMISKYMRELFMGMLNDYFVEQLPGLRRTAGYYEDGTRFVEDVKPICEQVGIPLNLLVRSR